ncbi:hypothetical protein B566_EDAN005356 [Ephemera danica]|nr:hypothetical protein B566_EDAN005356 [Ephemera danica]
MAVCQSDVSCATQSDPFAITDSYTCRGDPAKIENARLSFPSGHASMSFYCAVFIALHLQKRLEHENDLSGPPKFLSCFFLRPLLQGMVIMAAWFTSVSRVMDNQHHYRDIFVGTILGTVVALTIIRGIRPFRPAYLLDPHEETPLQQVQSSGGEQLNHHSNNHSTISARSDQ